MDPKSDFYKEHGEVQIYFSDETPYYKQSRSYQNISVIESKDGGDSWSKARLIAVSDVSGTIYLTKGKISGK